MAIKGKKSQFWEMKQSGGPYDDLPSQEIFKCIGCGAESLPEKGWSGEPDKHQCLPGCPCSGGWKIGSSRKYRQNYDVIFPNAPGAGL